jgi:hypothetical protein
MNSNNKQSNKWLALINIPFQMGLIIFGFSYLGSWLDTKYGVMLGQWLDEKYKIEGSTLTIIVSLLAVFLALYNVIQQVNKLNKDK